MCALAARPKQSFADKGVPKLELGHEGPLPGHEEGNTTRIAAERAGFFTMRVGFDPRQTRFGEKRVCFFAKQTGLFAVRVCMPGKRVCFGAKQLPVRSMRTGCSMSAIRRLFPLEVTAGTSAAMMLAWFWLSEFQTRRPRAWSSAGSRRARRSGRAPARTAPPEPANGARRRRRWSPKPGKQKLPKLKARRRNPTRLSRASEGV